MPPIHPSHPALPLGGFHAVLFDLDGTLIDTALDLGHAANLIREENGLTPLPLVDYRPFASGGARALLAIALGLTPEQPEFGYWRERFLQLYAQHLSRSSRLFPSMDLFLERLERRNQRWGVVTNKPSRFTEPLMQQLSLARRAACIVSADQVAQPKPAPDSLFHALELLGLQASQCVYIGDDLRDIQAARAAGMTSIAAAWGYIGESLPVSAWGADTVAQTVHDLLDWLP